MTRAQKNDFAQYCRQCTDAQVEGVIAKEREAGRKGYMRIAEAERDRRAELEAARGARWR